MRQISSIFLLLALLTSMTVEAAPVYLSPSNGFPSGEHPNEWLEKRTQEIRIQKWLRLKLDHKTYAWTSEDSVLSRSQLIGRAYLITGTNLLAKPQYKAEALRSMVSGDFVTLLEQQSAFLKVRSEDGFTGYIPRATAVISADLKEKEIVFLNSVVILRSAPTPDSQEIRRSQKFARHLVTETSQLKWGRVQIPSRGVAWWPLDENFKITTKVEWPKFSSSEIFLKRKIFDAAAHPTVSNLRFISANGIFRTIDDRKWEKIPKFGEQNYPVAMARSGRLFVGSWYSDDHGESFQSFVRFDRLVNTLKNRWRTHPRRFKFLEIKPVNQDGSELILKVDIGLKSPVQAITHDQGTSWKAL